MATVGASFVGVMTGAASAVPPPPAITASVPAAIAAPRRLRPAGMRPSVGPWVDRSDQYADPGSSPFGQLFERLCGIARGAHRAQHAVGVLAPARLEHELDGGLAHVQVEALAHVRDVDDVRRPPRPRR